MKRRLAHLLILLFFALISPLTSDPKEVQEAKNNGNLPLNNNNNKNNKVTVDVNVGVIFEEGSPVGMMGLKCIEMALSLFYKSHAHYNTRILLYPRLFPSNAVVGAAAAALYLLKNVEVKAIMGPIDFMEAEFVVQLGEKSQVPIISYSLMSHFQSFIQTSAYYIHTAQDELLQVQPIISLIKTFEWRQVVPIYVKNDYKSSAGFISLLADALQQIEARIPYHGTIPSSATDDQIREALYKLKTLQCRVFVVHMSPNELVSRLFLRANEVRMMEAGYAWILTTSIGNSIESLDLSVIESMQGALIIKTFVNETNELRDFKLQWGRREAHDMKFTVMGLWAYDSAIALAKAVEQVGVQIQNLRFEKKKKNISANSSTDLDSLRVSLAGPKLVQALLSSSFQGLAGTFRLTGGGQLESLNYQIVNLIGKSGRDIGFWTSKRGLERNLNSSVSKSASLRKIIWPGDVISEPKGWEIPTGGMKLKVGVPVKAVYEQLVNVSADGRNVRGFCIDVFDTVMEKLGYSGQYQFVPFAKPDGSTAGSYDDLVQQIPKQKYDIVVGDITILANRSNVDFTLPYTESGVTMVVPVKNEKKNAWVFLKPLTWELWVASLCAFIFIAFVIWILEHRINEEFRGPPSHQAGTSLFFSFSMAVFAQRENVLSNLTRFVVIVWVFVVLVLTQSYTASLTSMLTIQKLQPSVTDIQELIYKGDYVGFQVGSFIKELLQRKGFHESKLVSYDTSEKLHDLLSKGSKNGGISAVFDEIPYMKLFLTQYSSKYMMVQQLYKTDGFGFAFPRGSPLAPEVSRQILIVIEGDEIQEMENKWHLQLSNDNSEQMSTVTSGSLSLESFLGLFLIAGASSAFSLFIFSATFLYTHRKILMNTDASTRSKIRMLAKAFQQLDANFHTFRKNEVQSRRNVIDDVQENYISGNNEGIPLDHIGSPPTPSGYSEPDQVEDISSFSPMSTPPRTSEAQNAST